MAGLGSAGAAAGSADPSAAAGAANAADPTAGAGGAGGTTAGGTAATPAAGAGAAGGAAGAAGMLGSITKIPFLGPALAIAGGGLAMFAFKNSGATWMKAAGIGMAGSGLALTYAGAKAKGVEAGQQQLATALTPQVQALEQQLEQSQAQNQALVEKFQQMQAGGGATAADGSSGSSGASNSGSASGSAGNSGSSSLPGLPGSAASGTSGATGSSGTTGSSGATGAAPAQAQAIPDASWSPQAVVGQAVALPQGDAQVAASGSFALAGVLGDANGYASFAEADQVAAGSMSMDGSNVNAQRWIVLSHGGRFYAFQGQVDTDGIVPQLPQTNGTVAGYHAIRFVQGAQGGSWMQTGWTPSASGVTTAFSGTGTPIGGATAAAAPAAAASGAPVAGATAAAGTTGAAAANGGAATPAVGSTVNGVTYLPGGTTSGTPASGAQPAATGGAAASQPTPGASAGTTSSTASGVTGGGGTAPAAAAATAAPAFNPATLVGHGFQVNAAQVGTTAVAGGWLQLQSQASNGFATPGDAAESARASRTLDLAQNDAFGRFVTIKAGDGKYYAFKASIVNAAVPQLTGAAPAHVFGNGFAEYFDGTTWKAQADA